MDREQRRASILAVLAVAVGATTLGYTVATADEGAVRAREVDPKAGAASGDEARTQASCGSGGCGGDAGKGGEVR